MINKEEINSSLYRVIDANLNRLKEGIRVIEDIFRYIFNNKEIGYKLKEIRHLIRVKNYTEIIKSRDSMNDCLKENTKSELKRDDFNNLIIANFKRAQESARVLEEVYKLIEPNQSIIFKDVRYKLYDIEKSAIEILNS